MRRMIVYKAIKLIHCLHQFIFFAYMEFLVFKFTDFKWFLRTGIIALLAGFCFILKSTLGLLIPIWYGDLNNWMIWPLYCIFALIILTINKYSLSLIEHTNLKRLFNLIYYLTCVAFFIPVYSLITQVESTALIELFGLIIIISLLVSILIISISVSKVYISAFMDKLKSNT